MWRQASFFSSMKVWRERTWQVGDGISAALSSAASDPPNPPAIQSGLQLWERCGLTAQRLNRTRVDSRCWSLDLPVPGQHSCLSDHPQPQVLACNVSSHTIWRCWFRFSVLETVSQNASGTQQRRWRPAAALIPTRRHKLVAPLPFTPPSWRIKKQHSQRRLDLLRTPANESLQIHRFFMFEPARRGRETRLY